MNRERLTVSLPGDLAAYVRAYSDEHTGGNLSRGMSELVERAAIVDAVEALATHRSRDDRPTADDREAEREAAREEAAAA